MPVAAGPRPASARWWRAASRARGGSSKRFARATPYRASSCAPPLWATTVRAARSRSPRTLRPEATSWPGCARSGRARPSLRAATACASWPCASAVILSRRGGALAKMTPPFRLGLGGPIGPRERFFPWVHEDDAIGILRLALGEERALAARAPGEGREGEAGRGLPLEGPVNVVAPSPTRMGAFAAALGRALGRPAIVPVPLIALRLVLGEMAGMLSPGQNVTPRRALEAGYAFRSGPTGVMTCPCRSISTRKSPGRWRRPACFDGLVDERAVGLPRASTPVYSRRCSPSCFGWAPGAIVAAVAARDELDVGQADDRHRHARSGASSKKPIMGVIPAAIINPAIGEGRAGADHGGGAAENRRVAQRNQEAAGADKPRRRAPVDDGRASSSPRSVRC